MPGGERGEDPQVGLHRAMTRPGRLVHTAVLLPYGVITVVAAFAWQYAATPDLSFLSDRAWLGERWSSFAVVIATEVWKGTPVVALLLLAGFVISQALQRRYDRDGGAAPRPTPAVRPGAAQALDEAQIFRRLRQLQLGYATTVHKAQGSEFPAVVLPILTQHYLLLQRNLLYTAVTRGKRLFVLVGSRTALAMEIANDRPLRRNSLLEQRLRQGGN